MIQLEPSFGEGLVGKAGPNKNFQFCRHIRIHWGAFKKCLFPNSTHDDPGSIDKRWDVEIYIVCKALE